MAIYSQALTNLKTNEVVMGELGRRIEALRLRRDMTQADLAKEAGIGKRTLERLEAGQSVQLSSFIAVLRQLALLDELLAVVPDQSKSPVAMMLAEEAPRRRASGKRKKSAAQKPWRWGDEKREGDAP